MCDLPPCGSDAAGQNQFKLSFGVRDNSSVGRPERITEIDLCRSAARAMQNVVKARRTGQLYGPNGNYQCVHCCDTEVRWAFAARWPSSPNYWQPVCKPCFKALIEALF